MAVGKFIPGIKFKFIPVVCSLYGLVLVSKISNSTNQDILQSVPRTSILSPEGTILHGSNTNVQEDLRAKFEIYYTETEN